MWVAKCFIDQLLHLLNSQKTFHIKYLRDWYQNFIFLWPITIAIVDSMSGASEIVGIPECQECCECQECWECQERQIDIKCHTFSESQARGDLNDGGNFKNGRDFRNVRNVGNVRNFRNVRTDIKCYTFLEPQPRADWNDDGNLRNGGNFRNDWNGENVRNVRTYIKSQNFLKHKLELI